MTGTALKLIAMVLMTIDHIGVYIPGAPLWLRYIGRLSACIFFFCAVEGFSHTHDKKRYLMRLYLASIGMTVLDILLPLLLGQTAPIRANVFLEITGMMLLLYLLEMHRGNPKKQLISGILYAAYQIAVNSLVGAVLKYESIADERLVRALLACSVPEDANVLYVDLLILLFWFCRGDKKKLSAAFSGYVLFQIFWNVLAVPSRLPVIGEMFQAFGTVWERAFRTDFQWMMIFALPLLLSYNGQKGKGCKWLFYVYYPLHIGILYTVGVLLPA